ncbi:MAG: polysaccharide pyruvyl transferase family protein [Bacteroidales bacterium]|nr:polysaccharide pyruvyl transferase family protein [Bacteroidales bacterium]
MKIGILTYWWSEDNYGQQLQCYALQEYLRRLGHDPFLIRYDKRKDYPQSPMWVKCIKALNPIKLYHYFVFKIKNKMIAVEQSTHNRHFEEFREKYISQTEKIYYSYAELKNNPPEADVYIVGSDQVWNYTDYPQKDIHRALSAYMLDFVPKGKKRIAYAASWGLKAIDSKLKGEISLLLRGFSYISVREKSGVRICEDCGVQAEWVVDPTMLLPADTYRELYRGTSVPECKSKQYLLLYMLNNLQKYDVEPIYEFARKRNLDVVYITGNGVVDKRKKYFATIPEWLYLIDNAEYIVTNSFHCCVFSALFQKKYGAVKLTGKNAGMNERLESLFARFESIPRYIENNDFSALDITPYSHIESKFSKDFIDKILL